VQVSLGRQAGACVLTVRDDGRGFDPAGVGTKSLGIQGMRERAEMLGGSLDLRTRPGEGTSVVVTFPVAATVA
jgi:signal transduction histidine kinase